MADAPDPNELARRYLDLWQQHLTQAANDPDLAAGIAKLSQLVPQPFGAGLPGWPSGAGGNDDPSPATPSDAASDVSSGSSTTAAAPDGSGDGFDKLIGRLDAIEKRLDTVERRSGQGEKRSAKGSGERRS
jgi:hypothetical protein